MHDIVIRNGKIVDGLGVPAFHGDVAIDDGRLTQVGGKAGPAKREIAANGLVVAPGWVDVHTHYDGQVTWDPLLTPSSWHGVTTIVMGNCGVGFAPVRPHERQILIELMEGVEDIPGTVLSEGMTWNWESFPGYLNALEAMPRVIDVGTQIPFCALRTYVMGERGVKNEEANDTDLEQMAQLVREGVRAGALGLSMTRTYLHRSAKGERVPGTFADFKELSVLARATRDAGGGVIEVISDLHPPQDEVGWMTRLSKETGLPVVFSLLQIDRYPDRWREVVDLVDEANAGGAHLVAAFACRPVGVLFSWQSTFHPFTGKPTYDVLAAMPFAERIKRLNDPLIRKQIITEDRSGHVPLLARGQIDHFAQMFPLGDPPDYEPAAEESLAAAAERQGKSPIELAYDIMMENGGLGLIYVPAFNYSQRNLDHVHTLMNRDNTMVSLSDGGAHCGFICDVSFPTFLLTHWARDRRGAKLSLEKAVSMQTRETARVYGLNDRGCLSPGLRADLNLIDFEGLTLLRPEMVHDLPTGGRRLIQKASGYVATMTNGEIIFENGEHTGALPGRLIRGAR
jgi:N-acyl-D-aspartate/D-glutamate deacylase